MEHARVVRRPLVASSPNGDRSCHSSSPRCRRCRALFIAYTLLATGIIAVVLLFLLYRPSVDKTYLFFVGVLAAAIVNIINTITLLVGLHKHKRGCVLFFLIMESFLFVSVVVAVAVSCIKSGTYAFHLIHIIVFGFTSLVIIGQYYNQMEDTANNNNNNPRPQRDATLNF